MTSLGPVILDLLGMELTPIEREILCHPQVGGIILFTRNYQAIDQLTELIQQVRHATKKRLLISVDHEGGRVQRFREGFTRLPALGKIGEIYQEHPSQAKQLAQQHAWLMAMELLALDIDLSFAPILDLNKNISQVIGDRSFHNDPDIVTELSKNYLIGLKQAGMASVGKHFPGHGSVAADSHTHLPVDNRDYQTIAHDDLIPFTTLANDLNGIMPAHVVYSEVDNVPAGFSKIWLQKILRDQLNFSGTIFSDDLTMAGAYVIGDMHDRAQLALAAGCDSLLVCNDQNSAISVLEKLERQNFKNILGAQRLEKLVRKTSYNYHTLRKTTEWQTIVDTFQQTFDT